MNFALASFRLKNQLSSIIAPNWTAQKMGERFLTPERLEIKDWEQKAEEKGQRFKLNEDISAIRWMADYSAAQNKTAGKQILLVHGWESRATQMYGLVTGFLREGYTVVAVDMPAHGYSSGTMSNAYLFSQTVLLAQQQLGDFHAIIGHSMGAGATAIAVGQGVKTDKMVLISGPSKIENVLRQFSRFVGLNENTTSKFLTFISHYVGVPTTDLDAVKLLQKCEIPTLLIHDESDFEVPISESRNLASTIKNSELMVTQGLGHRRILKSEHVLLKINQFVMGM